MRALATAGRAWPRLAPRLLRLQLARCLRRPLLAPSAAASVPTVPTTPSSSPPTVPASHPRLTGSSSASSGGYSVKLGSLTADHSLDLAGYSGPPTLGLALHATCAEPNDAIVTWTISTGPDPTDETFASCFEGSFNPEGVPLTFCGSHVLAITPKSYGASIADPKLRPVAASMRFPSAIC